MYWCNYEVYGKMRIITILLILLCVSFYFMPDSTKDIVNITGKTVYNVGKQVWDNIKDTNEVQEYKEDVINKTQEVVKNGIP